MSSANNKPYFITSISGKGRGIVATSGIPKDSRIISESPIFKIPVLASDDRLTERIIVEELRSLSRDKQREFLSLCNSHRNGRSPFVGIVRTNALPLGPDAIRAGLFLRESRINHACNPNAQNTRNANLDQLTIHAVKEIEEGAEITISYLGRSESSTARQLKLKSSFGFDCSCELCSLPPDQLQRSDRRLEGITRLYDLIGDGIRIGFDPMECLSDARILLRLLEEEDIADARMPALYYDAFQIAIVNRDQVRAKIFAERAYAVRVVCEGDDSPDTMELKCLMRKPAEHRLYGTSVRWK